MGDISNLVICEQFVKDFGDEYLKHLNTGEVSFIENQGLDIDDDFNVRWGATLRLPNGEELSVLGTEVLFNAYMDENDTTNAVVDFLFGQEATDEQAAPIAERVAKMFETAFGEGEGEGE